MKFVGTCPADRTGANVKEDKKTMKVRSYKMVMYQHKNKPLLSTVRAQQLKISNLFNSIPIRPSTS